MVLAENIFIKKADDWFPLISLSTPSIIMDLSVIHNTLNLQIIT